MTEFVQVTAYDVRLGNEQPGKVLATQDHDDGAVVCTLSFRALVLGNKGQRNWILS